MEDLFPIGQFATASQLSQKALRLYAEKGLLPPAWVDPDSGYRYYRQEQLRTATLIALLRRAGMPLQEIRSFVRDPTPERLAQFESRETDAFAERRRVLRYLRKLVEEESMYDVLTRRVDEQHYVSRSRRLRVKDLEPFICETFDALGTDGPPAAPFVLYHGPVNEEDDGPVEVCMPRADGEGVLPEGEIAFTAIRGEQCFFPQILGAYEAVYRWVNEQGREPDGPAREIYVGWPGEVAMEIAVPLRAVD
ncbi:MAG TPA: MerR family transcriptional regulator [Gaiellaceae bacterium]|nr:MerR family transcriptional regulator [Gaiellaceae bacterium]